MRKSIFALVTAVAVLAAGGVAYAANVYTVTGSATPAGKGSAKKPVPKTLKFGLSVKDSNPANRGTPIRSFAIGAEGLVTYPEAFPHCTFSQANAGTVSSKCKKAKVGTGLVQNTVGPGSAPTTKLFCNLKLGSTTSAAAARTVASRSGWTAIRPPRRARARRRSAAPPRSTWPSRPRTSP